MYKLVVSGFDGTLIDQDEAISLSTMLEIDKIRKNKVLFAVATGRGISDILYYNRDFSFLDYIIAYNGAIVYDVRLNKIIFKKSISKAIIQKIFNNIDKEIYACLKDQKFILKDLEDINDIYKIEIVCKDKKDAIKVLDELSKLKCNISYNIAEVNGSYFVEVVSKDINKAFGIEKICLKKKIMSSEVCAIGDGENDIEMLKRVVLAGAVSNAISEVKKIARVHVNSNNDKGVEEFLKKIFL